MCFCKRCSRRRRHHHVEHQPVARHAHADCEQQPIVQEFDCGATKQIIQHKHIVKHRHDIINEYEVVHEHDCNYYDVVTEREVVRHNDFTNHVPNYCERTQDCACRLCRR